MTDLIAEARRAYHREWRAKNKEKIREYNQRFWIKKAQELQREQEAGRSGG